MNKLKIKVKSIFRCLRLEDLPTETDLFYMDKEDLVWWHGIITTEFKRSKSKELEVLLENAEVYIHFHECVNAI